MSVLSVADTAPTTDDRLFDALVRTDRRRHAWVWAESEADAMKAVLMPRETYPRYLASWHAMEARENGDDGFPDERLYQVTVLEVEE